MVWIKRILKGLAVLGIVVAFVLLALISAIFIMEKGPSETAKVLFVQTVREFAWGKEDGPLGFIPTMFLSKEEVREIVARGSMDDDIDDGTSSDTSKIDIDDDIVQDIQIIDISEGSYKAKLMIVADPSKVFMGVVPEFFYGQGQKVDEMIERYEAMGYNLVGGVNGGDFIDNGMNNSYTAMPLGAVMSEGQLYELSGPAEDYYYLSGFTKDNKFVMIKTSSIEQALEEVDYRDFVYTKHDTGPFLVMDGVALVNEVPGTAVYGGGKNPRTAIGQRADGAVLLLAVDGRQANSLGATFVELANIMLKYGAVNACAMDGGTSTQMFYNGDLISNPYSAYGVRKCPTAWLVKE